MQTVQIKLETIRGFSGEFERAEIFACWMMGGQHTMPAIFPWNGRRAQAAKGWQFEAGNGNDFGTDKLPKKRRGGRW